LDDPDRARPERKGVPVAGDHEDEPRRQVDDRRAPEAPKTTYFVAKAAALERDYTQAGCQNPTTSAAPAGCAKATLPSWSVSSPIVRVKR